MKLAMSHVVPDLVQKVLKGQDPLHILGDGTQVRHYTYGGDLASGIVTAMEHPDARNDDFNLSTARSTTVLELAEVIWRKIKGPDEPLRTVVGPGLRPRRRQAGPLHREGQAPSSASRPPPSLDDMLDEVIPWIRPGPRRRPDLIPDPGSEATPVGPPDATDGGVAAWSDEHRFTVAGTAFLAATVPIGVRPDEMVVIKPPALVRRYLDLLAERRPRRVVELGIKDGGSTALLALAGDPEVLLAVDLERDAPPLLSRLESSEALRGCLRTEYGVDQGDRTTLTRLVDADLPGGDVDLVIDDASHVLAPTRTSFEVLFPRLRPGGLYLVEDWSSECLNAQTLALLLPDDDDFDQRLTTVNRILQILNDPDRELPAEVRESMLRGARDPGDQAAPGGVFGALVAAAAQVDPAASGTARPPRPGRSPTWPSS